jgi:hypothetical protein
MALARGRATLRRGTCLGTDDAAYVGQYQRKLQRVGKNPLGLSINFGPKYRAETSRCLLIPALRLGGLAGADAHCQQLAAAVGAGNKTWRAYLSTASTPATPGINARDRIGNGPWQNAKGVVIAKDVNDLHTNAQINKANGLNEKGEPTKVRGDTPNQHDMLTGSTLEGRAFPPNMNLTCNNWTSGNFGSAMLGHSDREGIADTVYQHSWNSAHMSRDCTQPGLVATGGGGLFMCFAQ